ncbi:uncharacterized protein METZ01_LOCUS336367 [marine metagenome]|uniref:Uncharacterized protein n=1 Tax=marine metagenome TaxID=408172 RepID=A0A382QDA9_9ZZZZ
MDAAGQECGGGGGIRTHGTRKRTHAFQACALSHSATPPHSKSQDDYKPSIIMNVRQVRTQL